MNCFTSSVTVSASTAAALVAPLEDLDLFISKTDRTGWLVRPERRVDLEDAGSIRPPNRPLTPKDRGWVPLISAIMTSKGCW